MSLVTLKNYFSRTEDGYRKVIGMLLDGIAEHCVCSNSAELSTFRAQMQGIRDSAESGGLEQMFVAAGAAMQALESYNSRTTRVVRKQAAEMQNMISMLAQAVVSVGSGSDRSTEMLLHLKNELEQAAAIEEVHKLKLRLSECLRKVCDETSRHKNEAAAILQDLQNTVQQAQSCNHLQGDVDPVTGLPPATAARQAFVEGLKTAGRKYILTMVADRLQLINTRFGNAVGDQVLRSLRTYVETSVIQQGDLLFRWTGPTLVALMARPESIDQVRGALKRVLDRKMENMYEVGGRSALIPLSVAWSVIALIPPVANIPVYVDRFVAAQVPRDYC